MSTALDLPGRPYAVAVLNDETAFVSLRNDGEALAEGVAVVSLQENELRSVCGLAAPRGVAFTNDRRRLVVAQDHGALAILDVERLVAGEPECVVRQVATVANGSTGGVAVSLDGRYAFTAEERAFCISVIDIELACEGHLGALVGTIPAGFMPMSVLPSRDGRALYFSCQRTDPDHLFSYPLTAVPPDTYRLLEARLGPGQVGAFDLAAAVADPAAADPTAVLQIGNAVRTVSSSDGYLLWTTLRAENSVVVVDAAGPLRLSELARIEVGPAPVGICMALGDDFVLVTNSNRFDSSGAAGSVSVLDARRVREGVIHRIGELPAGTFPRDVQELPGGDVVVCNYGSATLLRFGRSEWLGDGTGR